ncbi:MAG TPA: hypothetical protein VKK31_29805 [Thermoanaerobaculia bacterium]|nr:hypothetical protein [Thermoanaerobaculia bacterium]
MDHNSMTDRRVFLKRAIQGAGLAFAAPTILSSLGSSALHAQASGPSGAATGRPYGSDGGAM